MDWSALPQGRDGCPRCTALEARVRDSERRLDDALALVARLETRVADLEDRLRVNSSNSSTAPSSDPLWAPNLKPKKPTGRKPGGQPGHPGHHRTPLPPDQLDAVVDHRPGRCPNCGTPIAPDAPAELRATRQVAELPPRAVTVTEHRSYACRCPACGTRATEPIPPDVLASCTGPRLSAALCYLSARVHGSRRAVEELAHEVLGLPLSLGTVSARERETAAALESPCKRVERHVRAAPVKYVDETGWRRAGRWLWTAATHSAALFRVDRGRNWHGLQNLLGRDVFGVVCSDRFGLYDHLKTGKRAVCWAHLKRDFQRWLDRGGPTARLGQEGLAVTADVFRLWHRFRLGKLSRRQLRRLLKPPRSRLRALLEWGATRGGGVTRATRFCRNVLRVEPALWTFARLTGLEPTNNHAERMLRPGVMWRKTSFGSHSQGGCRYAERMLTTIQTLRLQHRRVVDYLADALDAYRRRTTAPRLV
jgi:transposase